MGDIPPIDERLKTIDYLAEMHDKDFPLGDVLDTSISQVEILGLLHESYCPPQSLTDWLMHDMIRVTAKRYAEYKAMHKIY